MFHLHALFVPLLALAGLLAPGWLGVILDEDAEGRPMVSEVVPDSPASKAGIKAGDVLLAVDDKVTDTVEALVQTVGAREAGSKVKIKLRRDGKELVVEVELGTRPADLGAPPQGVRVAVPIKEKQDEGKQKKEEVKAEQNQPKTGLVPRDPKAAGKPYLGVELEEEDGRVRIASVVAGSPADKAGLAEGRLVSIAGSRIASLTDVDKVMGGLRAGQTVAITVRQGNETTTADVTLGAQGDAAAAEAGAKAKTEAEGAGQAARAAAEKARAEARKAKQEAERAQAAAKEKAGKDAATAPTKPESEVRASLREAKGKQPLLLVFGASWDASTKALKKSLADEKVQAALGERKVLWIDTDQNGQLADEYEVQQIPHMVLLDAVGKRAGVIEGFQPAEILADKLSGKGAGDMTATIRLRASDQPKAAEQRKPKAEAKPEGERNLHDEVRALREEIRELRGMLQELMRERRR